MARSFSSRLVLALAVLFPLSAVAGESDLPEPPESVRAEVQLRPGGPVEETEMPVHPAAVDPVTVAAREAPLEDDDLVLGVEIDGRAVAYPIRYVALYEVVDDRVGETPVAPTW